MTARTEPRVRNSAPKHTRVPVSLSAVELLAPWSTRPLVVGAGSGARDGSGCGRCGSRTRDRSAVTEAIECAQWWAGAARNLLEPGRMLPLRGARCPSCHFSTVVGPGDAGENEVELTLAADLRSGVVSCAVDGCGAAWPFDALEGLATQLAVQTSREVLAVDGFAG